MNRLYILIVVIIAFTSCKKDNDKPAEGIKAPLSLEFDNIAGGQNLFINGNTSYTNASGEQFKVSVLQYFISNIKLKKADGSEYIVPQDSSYFLIKEGTADDRYAKLNVPEGDYVSVSFILGVDSLRSTMDISKRTGVLDPGNGSHDGMYWGWASGYIFFKMEGTSPAAPVDGTGQNKFRYHIGGFGGYDEPSVNNIRNITVDLNAGGIAKVRSPRGTNIHLMVDILKVFDGTTTFKIADYPMVMLNPFSSNIANNFSGMFRHDHTEN